MTQMGTPTVILADAFGQNSSQLILWGCGPLPLHILRQAGDTWPAPPLLASVSESPCTGLLSGPSHQPGSLDRGLREAVAAPTWLPLPQAARYLLWALRPFNTDSRTPEDCILLREQVRRQSIFSRMVFFARFLHPDLAASFTDYSKRDLS